MKQEVLFFAKTFALGLGIVILMQYRVGGVSIESRAMGFVQSSAVVEPLHGVAHGGAKLIRDSVKYVKEKFRQTTSSFQNGK